MPIKSKVTQQELRKWHDDIEGRLQRHEICHVSYTPDGAANERRLERDVLTKAREADRMRRWRFTSRGGDTVVVEVPLLDNGKPRVLSSDGKHSRKNARGSVQSGAHTLGLGNYIAHIEQLVKIAKAVGGPLLYSDVVGVDKQDDRANARLFSSPVIQHISETDKIELGLAVYLFVGGDLVDAQQNRGMLHAKRMKILWRTRRFLDGWLQFIGDHPYYTARTHFISRELFEVFNLFIESMLGLILIHRDYHPNAPFLPWLHSTEVNEHFFGTARRINKDFSFWELLMMMPKMSLLMDNDIRSRGRDQAKATAHRAGYHHTWFDSRDLDYSNLATYPSDDEINFEILPNAFDEADQLLQALGIPVAKSTRAESSYTPGPTAPSTAHHDENWFEEDGLEEDVEDGLAADVPDKDGGDPASLLETMLLEESRATGRSNAEDDTFDQFAVSACAAVMHQEEIM